MSFIQKLKILAFICLMANPAFGVVLQKNLRKKTFITELSELTPSLILPLKERTQQVMPNAKVINKRIKQSQKDPRIEPISLFTNTSPKEILETAKSLAKKGQVKSLFKVIQRKIQESNKINLKRQSVEITGKDTKLVDPRKYAKFLKKDHLKLTLSGKSLRDDPKAKHSLIDQVKPYLSKKDLVRLKRKIAKEKSISIDKELLPQFAKKMVKKYIAYRGPNCFHAALSFQSPEITTSFGYNVKEETGYHRTMINYDELWRAVSTNFYEVDPETTSLKYGDIIMFFDVLDPNEPVNFKWIRHAAAYLFENYTFSKGSKSPNTPYTIKTLSEEFDTWKKYTKNFGVKVFRRFNNRANKRPPETLENWVY